MSNPAADVALINEVKAMIGNLNKAIEKAKNEGIELEIDVRVLNDLGVTYQRFHLISASRNYTV